MSAPESAVLGVVRSTVSRGRFGGLEGSEAAPGVRVLQNHDIPGRDRLDLHEGFLPVLVRRDIRHHGQPLALVVASDVSALHRALDGLSASEKPKIPVEDLHLAMQGGVRLFGQDNIFAERRVRRGDAAGAETRAAFVQEKEFRTGLQDPFESELPVFDAFREGDRLWIRGAFLEPERVAGHLASLLALPRRRIEVESDRPRSRIATDDAALLVPAGHAALAAWCDGRRIHYGISRAESLAFQPKRSPSEISVCIGYDTTGRIASLRVDALFDGGAFPLGAAALADEAILALQSAYRVDHLDGRVRVVATSSLPHGGVRATAATALVFAIERSLDLIAERLELPPAELRRRNFVRDGDLGPDGRKWRLGEDPSAVLDRARRALPAGEGLACCIWPKRDHARSLQRLRLRIGLKGDEVSHAQVALPEIAIESEVFETLTEAVAAQLGLEAKAVLVTGARLAAAGEVADPSALVERLMVLLERTGSPETLGARLRQEGLDTWCDEVPVEHEGSAERAGELLVVSAAVDLDPVTAELDSRELSVTVGATKITRDARRELGGAAAVAVGASWGEEVLVEYGRVANASALGYQPPRLGDLPPIALEGADEDGALRDPTEWWDWGAAPVAAALVGSIARRSGVVLHNLPLSPEDLVARDLSGGGA